MKTRKTAVQPLSLDGTQIITRAISEWSPGKRVRNTVQRFVAVWDNTARFSEITLTPLAN